MTEKNKGSTVPFVGVKPVPMKLFATWEVDRTPPNCIPRLCSLTLTRLLLLKSLGPDVTSLVIAVKIQGSKRTLRSNEMILPPNGLLDTELQLSFSLQYPHFLKRDGNRLYIMLQRRKKYKNRAILGYKTLVEGVINMSQVLQHQTEMELDLFNDCKESKGHNVVAKVNICSLSSQPVDHEENNKSSGRGVPDYSDEEEDFSSGNEDGEVEGGSDSEPVIDEQRRERKNKINGNVRQRNLKEKFISLLKRFRVNEDLQSLDNDQETISRKLSAVGEDINAVDIEDLFEELEDLSDSGPEVDTMSISSTPKPSLRPFFSSSRSLLHDGGNIPGRMLHRKNCYSLAKITAANGKNTEGMLEKVSDESSKRADSDSHQDNCTDSDPPPSIISTPKPDIEDKKLQTRKSFTDPVSKFFSSEDGLPDVLCLINTGEPLGNHLYNSLRDTEYKVIALSTSADIRTGMTLLISKIQKFCNSCLKPSPQIKVVLGGSDGYVHIVLRHYIEQLSTKSPDWISYIRFFIIPLSVGYLSKYLGSIDAVYHSLFSIENWKEKLENSDGEEIVSRIQRYVQEANFSIQIPIAEAMLAYKDKSSLEESSQVFIPFIMDVRLNNTDVVNTSSLDNTLDESQITSPVISIPSAILNTSSPPNSGNPDKRMEKPATPPSSPNINYHFTSQYNRDLCEPLELQVDYWLTSLKSNEIKNESVGGKKSDSGKLTLKTSFRSLQITKLSFGEVPVAQFSINYITKEKKQKIMRLGKKKEKEKENETRNQYIDGVCRLICSPRVQSIPLSVSIDGNEWTGVKFFQLSSQGQTYVRNFPISLFSVLPDSSVS